MNLVASLIRQIAILAVIGLVFAPVAPSVASSVMAMPMMAEMPDGMPCCPDDQPAIPDCAKDCPFAVVCTAVFVSATTHESSFSGPLPHTWRRRSVVAHRRPAPQTSQSLTVIGARSAGIRAEDRSDAIAWHPPCRTPCASTVH